MCSKRVHNLLDIYCETRLETVCSPTMGSFGKTSWPLVKFEPVPVPVSAVKNQCLRLLGHCHKSGWVHVDGRYKPHTGTSVVADWHAGEILHGIICFQETFPERKSLPTNLHWAELLYRQLTSNRASTEMLKRGRKQISDTVCLRW